MKPGLICLVRTHKWHNRSDNDEQKTVWTCARCDRTRVRIGEMDPQERLGLDELYSGDDGKKWLLEPLSAACNPRQRPGRPSLPPGVSRNRA